MASSRLVSLPDHEASASDCACASDDAGIFRNMDEVGDNARAGQWLVLTNGVLGGAA